MPQDRKQAELTAIGDSVESQGSTAGKVELEKDVLQIARYLLRSMNLPLDMADDLGQTVLLRYLHVNAEERKHIRNLKGYLYRMMKNQLLNQIKKEKLPIVTSLDSAEMEHPNLDNELVANSSDIELGVLARQVWNQLGPDDRQLFDLLTFGFSGRELAFRLGVSDDAARQRVSRLKVKLNAMLVSEAPSSE
jgi:RNA polymerase sigma factor (sigma-70 family)